MRIHYNAGVARALMALERSNRARTLTMERLSSGRRINRAADDAAGLAIAERLRALIRGLNQAVRNAQDGISLLQTADAGMGQMQEIVHRVRELSVRAASDALTWRDRLHIQEEVDQLTAELYAITQRTELNGRKVLGGVGGGEGKGGGGGLGGCLGPLSLQVGPNAGPGNTVTVELNAVDPGSLGLTPEVQGYVIEGNGIVAVEVSKSADGPAPLPSGAYEVRLHQDGGSVVTADGNLVLTTTKPRQFTLLIQESPQPTTYRSQVAVPVAVAGGTAGDGGAEESGASLTFTSYGHPQQFEVVVKKVQDLGVAARASWGWQEGRGNVLTVFVNATSSGNITATWQDVANAMSDPTLHAPVSVRASGNVTGRVQLPAEPLTITTRAAAIPTTATHDEGTGALRVTLGRNADGELSATWADVVAALNSIHPPTGITATPDDGTAIAFAWPPASGSGSGPAAGPASPLDLDSTASPALLTCGISFSLVDMDGHVVATQDTVRDNNSVELAGTVTLYWNTDLLDRIVPGPGLETDPGSYPGSDSANVSDSPISPGSYSGPDSPNASDSPVSPGSPPGSPPVSPSAWGLNIIGIVTADSPSKGVLVDTRQHAQAALSTLDTALSRLSGERSHVGALQSGLERTAANLEVYRENLTASVSRIEDADLAAEIATLAKQQILTQTATAMLAHANTQLETQLLALLETLTRP